MRNAKSTLMSTSLWAILFLFCTACGTNPVTGKRELQFVSESDEIQIGEKSYAPARQAEGGEMELMPQLSTYVNEVGQKLAAVADRKLPYEFKVLNNGVPNAWAMPGGKIAVNRGLLTELKSEAELAAVLGHEIVHAAARHGAKAQERGMLMQGGMVLAQVGVAMTGIDQNLAGLAVAGTGVSLQALQMKYGRDQELESDYYGMQYMQRAGYDPKAAIALQETFVRLSKERGGKAGLFERLFASHPPSAERVAKNMETAAALAAGGVIGEDAYRTRIAALTKAEPAYDKHEQAIAALKKKDLPKAKALAEEAQALLPHEGRFHELIGEIELAQKNYKDAVAHYEKAIQYNPNYFGSYLGGGIALYESGNKSKAREWLQHSQTLLPTKPAAYYLGNMARERGDTTAAAQHYRSAADSQSHYGQLAAREFVTLDLPQHPDEYVATAAQLDAGGRLVLVVQNRSPVALTDIRVTPVLVDAGNRIMQTGTTVVVSGVLESGKQTAVSAGSGTFNAAQMPALRVRVEGAKVAER